MKRFMKTMALVLVLAMCITCVSPIAYSDVQAAQKKTATKSKKKKVKLNKKKVTLRVGKTKKLKLKNAKTKKVKWSSSNKKVAKVTKKGVVKALKKGKATITAKYKGKKYKCKVKVKKAKKINKKPNLSARKISTSTLNQSIYLLDNLYEKKNILVSPASLNMVIGMAANGAVDAVKKDCETYLEKSIDSYNTYSKKLLSRSKDDPMLTMANGVWYREDLTVNPIFSDAVTNNYNAVVNKSPMDNTTVKEVNQWASDNTDGMIKKVLNEIPKETVTILANALLFKGEWTEPFEKEDIYKENFTKLDGTKEKVDMMHSNEDFYYENDYAIGFEKTYGDNKEYSFIAVLPKKTGEFNLANLDLESFLKTRTREYRVMVSMPKFTYSWNSSLSNVLKATSLKSLYQPELYPLNNMLQTEYPVYVSDISQTCKIIVDEKGTEAAAVTTIVAVMATAIGSLPEIKEVELNRPFGYIIVDNTTEDVLFMGKVVDPTRE